MRTDSVALKNVEVLVEGMSLLSRPANSQCPNFQPDDHNQTARTSNRARPGSSRFVCLAGFAGSLVAVFPSLLADLGWLWRVVGPLAILVAEGWFFPGLRARPSFTHEASLPQAPSHLPVPGRPVEKGATMDAWQLPSFRAWAAVNKTGRPQK